MARRRKKRRSKKRSHRSRKRSVAARRRRRNRHGQFVRSRGSSRRRGRRRTRKHGGRRRRRHGRRRTRKHGYGRMRGMGGILSRKRKRALVQRLIAKGYEPRDAHRLADRAMRIARIRHLGKEKSEREAAAHRQSMANLFGNIGQAGHLAATAGR